MFKALKDSEHYEQSLTVMKKILDAQRYREEETKSHGKMYNTDERRNERRNVINEIKEKLSRYIVEVQEVPSMSFL